MSSPGRKDSTSPAEPPSASTYSSQSTATSRLMSSVGRPTAVRMSSMVTRPALGILAAPTLASVAVRLSEQRRPGQRKRREDLAKPALAGNFKLQISRQP